MNKFSERAIYSTKNLCRSITNSLDRRTKFEIWFAFLSMECFGMEERMYEMPTELQYKDELRKEEIRIENELEMLRKKDYEQLEKQLKRNLERVRKSLKD